MLTDNEFYCWETDEPHATNEITMGDFLDNELTDQYEVQTVDGTYAEISESSSGFYWAVHAGGDGDFTHHKVKFDAIGYRR